MPTVTFEQFGIFFACALVLAGAVLLVVRGFRREPPLYREYASKSELETLSRRVDALGTEIRDGFRELDHKRSVSIAGLHTKVEEETKELNQRINAVPQRVIELLKTTKGLID